MTQLVVYASEKGSLATNSVGMRVVEEVVARRAFSACPRSLIVLYSLERLGAFLVVVILLAVAVVVPPEVQFCHICCVAPCGLFILNNGRLAAEVHGSII